MPRVAHPALALGVGLAVAACAACARPDATVGGPSRVAGAAPPRLVPPPALAVDDGPSAIYRTAVALHLQPSWAQFLEDCRLRLPADHPLNESTLVATAELVIDPDGQVASVRVGSSGNADYDRAVRQVIGDAVPLPRPPAELWSDDDRVYVRWLFARDRRQAGPATAVIEARELPVQDVVRRLVATGDLARAARRLAREPASVSRAAAAAELMFAALREALGSSDGTVRRAALDAIALLARGGVNASGFAPDVRDVLGATSDLELRAAALAATRALRDQTAVSLLLDLLHADLRAGVELAVAEVETLVALGAEAEVAQVLLGELDGVASPNRLAVQALVHVPAPELTAQIARWMRANDPGLRAAACGRAAWPDVLRGLRDGDATVRLRCIEAVRVRPRGTQAEMRQVAARLRALVADRDAVVREHAVRGLASLGVMPPDRHDDPAPGVRAAYAHALGLRAASLAESSARITELLDDRAPEVRAHALAALIAVTSDPARITAQVRAALRDPAAEVRAVAVLRADEVELARLATSDDDVTVRTEALVELARRRGQAASLSPVLERLAAAAPGSGERVRAALAWLLAR